MSEPLLNVENLAVEFKTDEGTVRAVDHVSFSVDRGETLGIVGESGSGKSVTNLALMGLVAKPAGRITSGQAIFDGSDLLKMNTRELSAIRGKRIAMIFQDPMTSLNPFLTIEEQMTEVTKLHLGHNRKEAIAHAIDMLERVGIPGASKRLYDYPHQFSGGMRQRVMIAMGLSCDPDLIIADEPTTALDVTIQSQILELMQTLQNEKGTAIILITHDLGVVAKACHRVNVMYAGRFVEKATLEKLFASPQHPYTLGLLRSLPRLDEEVAERLEPIVGQPPLLFNLPPGCAFEPRCPFATDRCSKERPTLGDGPAGGEYACNIDVATAPRREVHDV